MNTSAPSSMQGGGAEQFSNGFAHNLNREVKAQALAAVLLEEWLQELAAIAQEQSVLEKEIAFEVGMGLNNAKSCTAIIKEHNL